ncbi:MAG: hypothetical protein CMA63_00115 [Euryarchaeota archaeon]|nr:hypothetical protein [Euryarchaeota archaeon]|tara:strand:+ start:19203 stop:22244 length:3042 start_codon:yes stop_codon:yes gene_type:complete
MSKRTVTALILVGLMFTSGCMGAIESDSDLTDEPEIELESISLTASWELAPSQGLVNDAPIQFNVKIQATGQDWTASPMIISPSIELVAEFEWEKTPLGYTLQLTPTEIGSYLVQVDFATTNGAVFALPIPEPLTHTLNVTPVQELAPVLSAPVAIELSEPTIIWFEGSVTHSSITTCTLDYSVRNGESGTVFVRDDGTWKRMIDFSELSDSTAITTTVTCGEFTALSDTVTTQIYLDSPGNDTDGDGILDLVDRCMDGYGAEEGWVSTDESDIDGDGCNDFHEDLDDDNDGVGDDFDECPDSVGWVSTPYADYDSDGCHDADEDLDDDGDGVLDEFDDCPSGQLGWGSNFYSDRDGDGCADLDEDSDDDNDGLEDELDACPRGQSNWFRNTSSDFDDDGCADQSEDEDDDNDGVNDVNITGDMLDRCPRTALNSTDVDQNGCSALQRDTDLDGVNDAHDQCEGTPSGLTVNDVGCADLDNDGVYANVDQCPNSPERWTIEIDGCAVIQQPVAWKSSSPLTGPMQIVPQFSTPTLNGTYYFQQRWTGYDVYFFMFKYTDADGNGNSATWGQNPGPFIRSLPDNVHLFYGSFDTTYHADILNRKAAVENALNPSEEDAWEGRIHYIDQRANGINGGLGQMISSFNSPLYMGIDRFQMARETGSLYAWTSSNNDPMHLVHEPKQWNAEFPVESRRHDSGIHEVKLWDFDAHSGGWGGGFTSAQTSILPSNMSQFDTMEVYHEHACEDRMNRHTKADGSTGGCHEWDYEANLRICDRANASSCGTEFMRWITTYGREGKWLTDISPYLFMLEDDDNRTFKYRGANKGDLTITLLLSNWGSGLRASSADFAFTGGQFDGTYNNESMYDRSLNFTVPSWAERVEIVATITGHGFNKDNANCAEFCDHQHHYYLNGFTTYEWHPLVYSNEGCENEVSNGVVANQFGSWPFGRAGWCAGQDVKQWTYDITSWSDMSGSVNELTYRGLFNGQEYQPSDGIGNGQRNIHAEIWVVYYAATLQ